MQLYQKALQDALDLQKEEFMTDTEITLVVEALAEAESHLNPAPELDASDLEREISLANSYDLAKYLDGEEKDIFRSSLANASALLERIHQMMVLSRSRWLMKQ